MKKLGHIAAALVLAAGFIYLAVAPKDDDQMAAFKQSAAAFIRSEKQSAPVREVLGRGGDRICVSYPYVHAGQKKQTAKSQLLLMFPARASEIDKLEISNKKSDLVIGINNNKELAVMTGRRDLVVGDKTYMIAAPHRKGLGLGEGFGCFNYATAKFSKLTDTQSTGTENILLLSGELSNNSPKSTPNKPQQKKKPPPAPEKKKPAQRSYGY